MSSQPWTNLVDEAVALRHSLHRKPELAYAEHQTAATIRQRLDVLGIPWEPCADTGTLGRLAINKRGRHIALRGEMGVTRSSSEGLSCLLDGSSGLLKVRTLSVQRPVPVLAAWVHVWFAVTLVIPQLADPRSLLPKCV